MRSSNKAIIRKHPPRPGSCQQAEIPAQPCPTQDRLGRCYARSLQCSSDWATSLLTALTKVTARVWVMDYLRCNNHLTPRCYFIISNSAKQSQIMPKSGSVHHASCIIIAGTLSLRDIKRSQNESFKNLTIRENGSFAFITSHIK